MKFLFKQDSEGKILFFPWGHPGESYVLSPNQQQAISNYIFMLMVGFVAALLACNFIYYLDFADLYSKAFIQSLICFVFPLVYFLKIKSFTSQLDAIHHEERKLPKILYIVAILFTVQLATIIGAWSTFQLAPLKATFILIVSALYLVILTYFFANQLRSYLNKHAAV